MSGLVAAQMRDSVQAEDAFEAARRTALELLEKGFHLGGGRFAATSCMSARAFVDTNVLVHAEGMSPGRSISGMRIVNPFAAPR